jgi:hypothetical protein
MKKYIPFVLFAIVPLFYSCASNDEPDYAPPIPFITAQINSEKWVSILTDTLQNDSIILHAKYKRDFLRIKFPLSAQSSYTLLPGDVKYFTYDISDTKVTKTFKLDPAYQGIVSNLVVNTVSPIHKYVTGQFNLRLIIDTAGINTDTTGTNTVTFTRGQFVAPYN